MEEAAVEEVRYMTPSVENLEAEVEGH